VLGKYLGAVSILLIMTLGTAINVVPLVMYGNPELSTILSGYLGFVLLGMACLAIGQFFSALTQNQIVAALLTVVVVLGLWFVGHAQAFQSTPGMRALLSHLSFAIHYGGFIQGLVRSEAIAFYLAVTGIALVLNAGWLQWRR